MRVSWDETWMAVADAIAQRSMCSRRQAGAVIVAPTQRVVSVGYNGPPRGWTYIPKGEWAFQRPFSERRLPVGECSDWCTRGLAGPAGHGYDDCPSIHAEANALMHNDRRDSEGGTLYVNTAVCMDCAKLVSNSGLARVALRILDGDDHRHPQRSIEFMRDSRLKVLVVP